MVTWVSFKIHLNNIKFKDKMVKNEWKDKDIIDMIILNHQWKTTSQAIEVDFWK